jgi:hypothetical protein
MQTSLVFILAITHVGTWNLAPNPGLYLLSVLNVSFLGFLEFEGVGISGNVAVFGYGDNCKFEHKILIYKHVI